MGKYMVRLRIQQVHRRSAGKSSRRQSLGNTDSVVPIVPSPTVNAFPARVSSK